MIRYDNDFVTLVDGAGNKTGIRDSNYFNVLQIMTAQQTAISENTAAQTDYLTKLHNVQISVDAGRGDGIIAPIKPQQKVVDDKGVVSFVDFNPPLPELKPYIGGTSVGIGPTTRNVPDPMMVLLLAINAKLDKLLQGK